MAPAAIILSPVARDYLSRALEKLFSPSRSRLFFQGTGRKLNAPHAKEKAFLFTSSSHLDPLKIGE
jgi:hypothetical protein